MCVLVRACACLCVLVRAWTLCCFHRLINVSEVVTSYGRVCNRFGQSL